MLRPPLSFERRRPMGVVKVEGSPGSIEIMDFKPHAAGSLVGFVDVHITGWRQRIYGCTVHQSHGKRWIGLPGKPSLINGMPARDEVGKIRYFPVVQFDDDTIRRRFSDAVIAELERIEPNVFATAER